MPAHGRQPVADERAEQRREQHAWHTQSARQAEVGLPLRRRPRRRHRRHEGPARRQGRQPRRDGEPRPAGAAGLHHHDRGLHRLLRQRPQAARRPRAAEVRGGAAPRSARRSAPASATPTSPLLVSVRSGARASMPGMMDTILNLGLNDETVEGPRRALRRRALRLRQLSPLHPDVLRRRARRRPRRVRGHPREPQEPERRSPRHRSRRPTTGCEVIADYKAAVERETGTPFPQDTAEQLWGAIGAVFGSWQNARAITYRRLHDIPDELGHGRQRAGDGVRQPGRHVGDRRRLHAQSLDRRAARSTASSWSTRRARTSSPASARRSR